MLVTLSPFVGLVMKASYSTTKLETPLFSLLWPICFFNWANPSLSSLFFFKQQSDHWLVFSVTRLGDFWNFLATNFLTKIAKIFVDLWGCFKNFSFTYSKNCRVYLHGQLLENLGNFLFQHLITLQRVIKLLWP